MMKKIIYLFLICLLSACAPAYNPTPSHPFLFQEEGEKQQGASFSGSAANLHLAKSLTGHFAVGVALNGFANLHTEAPGAGSLNREPSWGLNGDFLAGFYKAKGKPRLELLGGYGWSWANAKEVNGMMHKLYLQPAFGWREETTEGAFSLRFTRLLVGGSTWINSDRFDSRTFLEPMFTVRSGKSTKFVFQIGISFSPPTSQARAQLESNPLLIAIGIHKRLGEHKP